MVYLPTFTNHKNQVEVQVNIPYMGPYEYTYILQYIKTDML